ncbi:LytR/AlgR family response regulator transcription factor [Lewinella sp. IMCC34183]|uniref:LytR/AlgR family response regulator transcription factor n=1 Tax=Lewinella sp. IMCC34183 TaxID=2248762 RepID=UPI000E245079|nr:response regulator [Lewinella sp. IMCC34183]
MNTPVSVLVVEDEMIIAAKISLHLEQLGYSVAGILPRGEEAVAFCRATPPDVLLLDINLRGALDGVETARALLAAGLQVPTVFLTANSDAASFERARTTHPRAFLSKPYQKEELYRAITLAVDGLHTAPPAPAPEPAEGGVLDDRIFIRDRGRLTKVYLADVRYVEAERAYARIHTTTGEYLLSVPLGTVEKQLQGKDFLRVHRSYILNLRRVEAVADTHVVVGKRSLPVSRNRREELLRRINLIR